MATKSTTRASRPVSHGEQLIAFLQREWDTLGTTRGAWCRVADLPDSTVHRWGQGNEPDMRNLGLVAAALGRPLLEVLLAAGYVDPAEVVAIGKRLQRVEGVELDTTRGVTERHAPLLADALRPVERGGDPTMSEAKREAMRQMSDAFDQVESGAQASVRRRVTPRNHGRRS